MKRYTRCFRENQNNKHTQNRRLSLKQLNRLFCVQIFTHLCNDPTVVWRHAFYALFLASLCVCAYFPSVLFSFLSYFFHFVIYGLQFFAKAGIINGDIVAFVPLSSTKTYKPYATHPRKKKGRMPYVNRICTQRWGRVIPYAVRGKIRVAQAATKRNHKSKESFCFRKQNQ